MSLKKDSKRRNAKQTNFSFWKIFFLFLILILGYRSLEKWIQRVPVYVFLNQNSFNALVLVNYETKVPENYDGKLIEFGDCQISSYMAYDLTRMIEAAEKENVELVINNAYRSFEEQSDIFSRRVQALEEEGWSYEKACQEVKKTVNEPGYSEHELGLAIDFSVNHAEKNQKMWNWLAENAQEYGFILRYPKNKEKITKISYEAWHYRYVGSSKVAKDMKEKDLCLEEYLEQVEFKNEK